MNTHTEKNVYSDARRCRTIRMRWLIVGAVSSWLCLPAVGYATSIGECNHETLDKLQRSIENHNRNAYRLNVKFRDVWYYKGPVPGGPATINITLERIVSYLGALGDRTSAVLFHQVERGRLLTWLITSKWNTVCAKSRALKPDDWKVLEPRNWSSLGTRGARQARTATPLDNYEQGTGDQSAEWTKLLKKLSELLLPSEITSELQSSHADTLIVVPITISESQSPSYSSPRTRLEDPSVRRTLSLSTVPFAALPLGADPLITKLSVVIAPGFFSFVEAPIGQGRKYDYPIVLGNPANTKYPSLPGAEEEAQYVAKRLGTQAFVKDSATKEVLEGYLKQNPNRDYS